MLRLSRAVEHLKRKVSSIGIDLGEVEALEVVSALRMARGSMSYLEKFYARHHRSPKLFRRFISAVRGPALTLHGSGQTCRASCNEGGGIFENAPSLLTPERS
jgi:hypothetical protein